MSSKAIVLPCSILVVNGVERQEEDIKITLSRSESRVLMIISAGTEGAVRVESDLISCKLSQYDDKSLLMVIMAAEIMFNYPLSPPLMKFWGVKDKEKTAVVKLGVQFDTTSPKWSWKNYESFVKSIQPNISWNFSILKGSEETSKAWEEVEPSQQQASLNPINISEGEDAPQFDNDPILLKRENILASDIARLRPKVWLNDAILNWAMGHLLQVTLGTIPDFASNIWLATSLFVSKMRDVTVQSAERWYSDVNILELEYYLLPIHSIKREHWFLMIVQNDVAQNRFLLFILDSLRQATAPEEEAVVVEWLKVLALQEGRNRNISVIYPKVPQQPNDFDCGIYSIHFVETFLRDPLGHVQFMIENNESENGKDVGGTQAEFDEKWRTSSLAGYREELREEIIRQGHEETAENIKKSAKLAAELDEKLKKMKKSKIKK